MTRFFALLLVLAGCTHQVADRPEDVREITDDIVRITRPIEYTDDTIFPEEDPRLLDTEVELERLVFHYDGEPTLAIDDGAVVVGGVEDVPYLRRVLSVERDGNVLTLHTRDAMPEEAIRNGAWSYGIGQPYGMDALREALEEDRMDELLDEAAASRADEVGGRSAALGDGDVGGIQQASRRGQPLGRSLSRALENSRIECRYEGGNLTTTVDVAFENDIRVDSQIADGDRIDSVDAAFRMAVTLNTSGGFAQGAECAREIESRNFLPYPARGNRIIVVAGVPIWFDMKAVVYGKVAIKARLGNIDGRSTQKYVYEVRYTSEEREPVGDICVVDLAQAQQAGRTASGREECEAATECETACSPDICRADDPVSCEVCCGAPAPDAQAMYFDVPVVAIDNTYVCTYNRFLEVPCTAADTLGIEYERQDGSRGLAKSSQDTWRWRVSQTVEPVHAQMDSGRGLTMDFEIEGGVLFELMLYRILYFEMKVGPKVGTTMNVNRDTCRVDFETSADLGVNLEVGVREPLFLSDVMKWEYRISAVEAAPRSRGFDIPGCTPRTSVSCDRHSDCTRCAQQDGCSWVSRDDVVDVNSSPAGGSCMADHEVPRYPRDLWVASNVNLCVNCGAMTTRQCGEVSGFCGVCNDGSIHHGRCINHSTQSPHVTGPLSCGSWE